MPNPRQIGDLLAQISGDKSQSGSPAPTKPPVATASKRKADDDPRGAASNKTPRTSIVGAGSSASKSASAPRPAARPADRPTAATTVTGYRGSAARPSDRGTSAPRPLGNGNSSAKSSSSGGRPINGLASSKATSTLPSRPSPSTAAPAKAGPPPKKGSFAEILARAKKAQESMGQVGKIQHKPVEKVLTKKEREEMTKDAKKDSKAPGAKGAAARQPSQFQGTARPSSGAAGRNGVGANGNARNGTVDTVKDPRAAAKARTAQEENEKKLKKAALATTGYTGTARPRPGASTTKKKPAPGGALLNARPAPRYGGSAKRSRYEEEEDEDMDDFIEYDEDEEEAGGPRYTYDSDASSDMEAGMDDVWQEELKAERVARREDLEQEKLEKRLKAEKEERKRKFWAEQQQRERR
ncbi:spt2 chromatin protein [Colletotrichum musicola]|uniref:Spt2 chromatin protein n=1 Tax=Colletotrichum musicola TaxID=2175873 RepID=A0A8H6NZL0_9PEZI|nr:spt2 chromatin protein [Colletotrichum musicola]